MATRNSSGAVRRRARRDGKRPRLRSSSKPRRKHAFDLSKTRTELYTVLDHLMDALSVVTTAARALEAAEMNAECATVGPEIASLRQGVNALRTVHQELDSAIPPLAS